MDCEALRADAMLQQAEDWLHVLTADEIFLLHSKANEYHHTNSLKGPPFSQAAATMAVGSLSRAAAGSMNGTLVKLAFWCTQSTLE